jgi:superfamily I DNA and/or RNA helicase
MMTRAKKALIVVGNRRTLESDEVWKAWIEWCEQNNLIVLENHLLKCSFNNSEDIDLI